AAGPPKIDCTIAGLTLTGGRTSGVSDPFFATFSGGAIRSPGTGKLTIDHCVVRENGVVGNASVGAIFAGGDVAIVASTISGNTASSRSGEAVYSFGKVTATDSTIRDNQGGGIDAWGDVS